MVKLASAELPTAMVVWGRCFFGLVVLVPWIFRHFRRAARTRAPQLHLVRTLSGLSAMYCYFYAISKLPLAEAVLLNFSAPLFIPLLASAWLKEGVGRTVRWAIMVGFAGVFLILRPGFHGFGPAAWVALFSAVLAALAMVSIRRMAGQESTLSIVFYFSVGGAVISSLGLLHGWVSPSPRAWLYLAAAGTAATSAQFLMARGFLYAPAAQVGPFQYFTVVFAAVYGWMFWAEMPDLVSAVGAALIFAAGALSTRASNLPPRV